MNTYILGKKTDNGGFQVSMHSERDTIPWYPTVKQAQDFRDANLDDSWKVFSIIQVIG